MTTDWRDSTLGTELELVYGKSLPERSRAPGDVPVFGSNGIIGSHTVPLVDAPGIIVGRKGSAGEVTFAQKPFWPIDTTYYVRNEAGHDWRYLYYLLKHCKLTDLNSHSAVPGLNRESAYVVPVSLPDLDAQVAISQRLDRVECAVSIEEQLCRSTRELRSAVMAELFSGGLRGEGQRDMEIGPVPEGWDVVPLGRYLTKAQYGLSVKGQREGQYPILRMNCQVDGRVIFRDLQYVELDESTFRAFRLEPGDLLFNRTNSFELVGRMALYKEKRDTVFASYLIRLSLDKSVLDPAFVNYYFNQPSVQADLKRLASKGVSQANISASKLRDYPIPKPPSLDEQREIVEILTTIDRKLEIHERRRALLGELFDTLLEDLMTGRRRVAEVASNTTAAMV